VLLLASEVAAEAPPEEVVEPPVGPLDPDSCVSPVVAVAQAQTPPLKIVNVTRARFT
jgi:hypothetical protein